MQRLSRPSRHAHAPPLFRPQLQWSFLPK